MPTCGFSPWRARLDRDGYLALAERHCRAQVARGDFSPDTWQTFAQRVDYFAMDASQRSDYLRLAQHLGQPTAACGSTTWPLRPICSNPSPPTWKAQGLAGDDARIVLEKPIGHSLDSALEINEAIGAVFPEARIYRIDHYLGETVQNLMALRFANALFEPIWRAGHIDHVQITVAETLGVENRGGYYDNAGAMRDMLQNHLLQLLCLVAMEAPVRFDAKHIRGEKVKVLEALKPITGNDVLDKTVRGQYGAGRIGGHDVPAYYFEPNIDNDSDTETFVAVKAEIDNWRWAGVPFYLRTGKRMARKRSEIIITFKQVPHLLFAKGEVNRLVISLQPEESISLQLMAKAPGKACSSSRWNWTSTWPMPSAAPAAGRPTSVCCWMSSKAIRRCSCAATRWKPPGTGSIRSCAAGAATTANRDPTRPARTVRNKHTSSSNGKATAGGNEPFRDQKVTG